MPVKDQTTNLDNSSVTFQNGVLTVTFTRQRDTGDSSQDVKFSDSDADCWYFLYPWSGGQVTGGNLGIHTGTPVISNDKICIRSCDISITPPRAAASSVFVDWYVVATLLMLYAKNQF